ncbi:hypothetical protein SEPCBS119000_002654 [Sporothrix epigloea]|uniref:Uncharacterized protein n=1 Tax=Sporothrix epigloea TaxID=1892477 RepID=A0ABP0DH99_9PEZI
MSDLKNTMSDEEQAAEAKSIASQLDAEFKANTDAELRHFLDSVKPGTMADDDLLMLFQGFEDWDVDRFKAADRITLIEVRSLLMQRGIYVANPRNSKDLMAKYLCDTATAEDLPEWPDRALATFSSKTVMKTFSLDLQERVDHSRIDPQYLLPPMTGIRAASPAPPDAAAHGKSTTPTGKPDGSNGSGDLLARYLFNAARAEDPPKWPARALATFARSSIMKTSNPDLQENVDASRIDPDYLLPPMTGVIRNPPAPFDTASSYSVIMTDNNDDDDDWQVEVLTQDAEYAAMHTNDCDLNESQFATPNPVAASLPGVATTLFRSVMTVTQRATPLRGAVAFPKQSLSPTLPNQQAR